MLRAVRVNRTVMLREVKHSVELRETADLGVWVLFVTMRDTFHIMFFDG